MRIGGNAASDGLTSKCESELDCSALDSSELDGSGLDGSELDGSELP